MTTQEMEREFTVREENVKRLAGYLSIPDNLHMARLIYNLREEVELYKAKYNKLETMVEQLQEAHNDCARQVEDLQNAEESLSNRIYRIDHRDDY